MIIMDFIRVLYGRVLSIIDPVGYCRKLGANIGEDCVCKANMLGSEPWLITIGNHVLIADGARLLTHDGAGWCLNYNTDRKKRMDMWGKVVIGNNVYIGVNAIIMPNVHITDNVIIGAGSIVTKDILEDGVYIGSPAQRIKSYVEWSTHVLKKAHNTYGMSKWERRQFFDKLLDKNQEIL